MTPTSKVTVSVIRPSQIHPVEAETEEVTEQDFLDALAAEVAPVVRRPYEFTISEIMTAVSKSRADGQEPPTRGAIKRKLDQLYTKKVLDRRKGFFESEGEQRREQWAYTILNVNGRRPEAIFTGSLLADTDE